MRVLYLLRYFPTLTETFIYEEIRALQTLSTDLEIVIASMGRRADGALAKALPTVEVLDVPRRSMRGWLRPETEGQRWLREHQRPKDAARLPWLAHRLREFARIHVHFAGEAAEWAVALKYDLGLPFTMMVHAVDLFRPRPSLPTLLQEAQAVLTVADHHVDVLREQYGVAAQRVRCGPDLTRFTPSPTPSDPFRALFVGRDVPKKGLNILLAAWRQLELPGAQLDVISDAHRANTPIGVTIHGLQRPSLVRAAIHAAHVVVLPCLQAEDGDQDGVPLVLMEALASGRPVISTPVSGIPELVDAEVGWLVPPASAEALAKVLEEVRTEPAERQRRGHNGPARLHTRGFTLQQQARSVLACWAANSRPKM